MKISRKRYIHHVSPGISTDAAHHPLGTKLSEGLPDPTNLILPVAFDGADLAVLP